MVSITRPFSIFGVGLLLLLAVVLSDFQRVSSVPVGGQSENVEDDHDHSLSDKYPVMVPVSSTVIPLMLFGKPKPIRSGTQRPRSSLYISPERRARLLERSNRPDTPVRLITKNTRQKDLNNETH